MAEAAYEDEKDCQYFADHSSQRSAKYIFVHFVVFFLQKKQEINIWPNLPGTNEAEMQIAF